MPCQLAIQDTLTGLWLKTYSTNLENCVFDSASEALCCDALSQPEYQGMLDNMNEQAGSARFIGGHPHAH